MLVHPNIKVATGDEFKLLKGVQSLEDKTLGLVDELPRQLGRTRLLVRTGLLLCQATFC